MSKKGRMLKKELKNAKENLLHLSVCFSELSKDNSEKDYLIEKYRNFFRCPEIKVEKEYTFSDSFDYYNLTFTLEFPEPRFPSLRKTTKVHKWLIEDEHRRNSVCGDVLQEFAREFIKTFRVAIYK